MKKKHLDLALCTVLLCLDSVYFYTAMTARKYKGAVVGPFDFSKYLAIAFAVFCVMIIVNTLRDKGENEKLTIDNFGLVVFTVAATALLLLLWSAFGMFYLWAFLYVASLLFVFTWKSGLLDKKNAVFCFALAAATILIVYLLFKVMMKINL